MNKSLILLGAGGHAAVLTEVLKVLQLRILGFTDVRTPDTATLLTELDFLGDDAALLSSHHPEDIQLVNGLGSTGGMKQRAALFKRFTEEHYEFTNVIHPSACISPSVSHAPGLQILAGAIINTGAQIGANVLVNSRAVVEHHCHISDHCHIASGAIVCGNCHIGQSVHVGAGAVINQGITIGDGAIIASGAVVIADVPSNCLVAGVPAQLKTRRKAHE
jgi:sugar O-acyltransferase (sialic acid O-acetyltransferase NeuD family)